MAQPVAFPTMSAYDSAAFVGEVAFPTWAKGVIIRRRMMVGIAERLALDNRAVKRMQKLRATYGDGPLLVRNPVRPQVVLLSGDDVRRVLEGAPDPFSPASREKRAALSHFEPHVSLITPGPERAERRTFNDKVLDSACPVHRKGAELVAVVEEEADELMRLAVPSGELGWDLFFESWFRIVRRIVLGSGARNDHELTDAVARLRGRANWAFAVPKNRRLRDAFHHRLQGHLDRAEPGSLAEVVARTPATDETHPTHQIAQWLFAFDPGAMATFRTLALLVAHPDKLGVARAEIASTKPRTELSYLRAAIVESLRLYPTTPMVLRETTRETEWADGSLPEGTGILIYTPFFHRDDERLKNAHRFEPEMWLGKDPGDAIPLIPFSAGPAVCPARHLVPMIGSAMLARLLQNDREITLRQPDRLDRHQPLPGTLDNYTLQFDLPA